MKASEIEALEHFTHQFALRMNNHKQYSKKEVAMALEDIAD
jgi:hypothetical protein